MATTVEAEAAALDQEVKACVAGGLEFLRKNMNASFITKALGDNSKEQRTRLYTLAFTTLPISQLFVVIEVLDRLGEYVSRDADAYDADEASPVYPKTRTNLDATIKAWWKNTLKPAVEKYEKSMVEQDMDDEEDENPYHRVSDVLSRVIKTLAKEF